MICSAATVNSAGAGGGANVCAATDVASTATTSEKPKFRAKTRVSIEVRSVVSVWVFRVAEPLLARTVGSRMGWVTHGLTSHREYRSRNGRGQRIHPIFVPISRVAGSERDARGSADRMVYVRGRQGLRRLSGAGRFRPSGSRRRRPAIDPPYDTTGTTVPYAATMHAIVDAVQECSTRE